MSHLELNLTHNLVVSRYLKANAVALPAAFGILRKKSARAILFSHSAEKMSRPRLKGGRHEKKARRVFWNDRFYTGGGIHTDRMLVVE
ncbi:MAG: hypothetical protein LBL44_06360 [Treponema sp.]|jgi:hypothetical protein|nr:hypothetical protein [Treponema sp.]